jgi:hypothetical protein
MNNTRYIEINSTYRDRNLWPLSSEFEIPMSQTGKKMIEDSIDPVSLSMPIFSWTSNNLFINGAATVPLTGNILSGTVIDPSTDSIGYCSDNLTFVILTTNPPQQLKNYYVGLIIRDTQSADPRPIRRITNSIYLGQTTSGQYRTQISVFNTFSDIFKYGDAVEINDPTDFTNVNNPYIYIPDGALQENYYNEYLIYNQTRNQYRPISAYNSITHLITINTATNTLPTNLSGPINIWQTTDNYSVRLQEPSIPFLGSSNPTVYNTINAIITPTKTRVYTTTAYTIIITDPSNNTLSRSQNAYKNQFLRILPFGDNNTTPTDPLYEYDPTPSNNQARRITNYSYYKDNTTGNFFGIFSVYPGFNITTPLFDSVSSTGASIEILPFSFDNFNPFVYSGSLVSQQDTVCYEIQLLSLTLPNAILAIGNGGRIAFYPYVYVQLSNVSATGASLKNIIYSNNPNATNVIFRAPVYDTQDPLNTPYTRIDGGGMVQTIKFKPNDNLYFKVSLYSGESYETVVPEYYSPSTPNPRAQVTAVFSIKRLT